ncbi:MAG TPA: hypothetical protein VJ843_00355 [Candidatus Saccharimonadales bacterium]|nr:hypothetical protein [Candidatus Saccharimonadales bacterium]
MSSQLDSHDTLQDEPDDLLGFDQQDRPQMIDAIKASGPGWTEPTQSITFSASIGWRPDLINNDTAVCHLHIVNKLYPHIIKRIKAARAAQRQVIVAAPLNAWYSNETLSSLDELEICPLLLQPKGQRNPSEWTAKQYRSIAELIAMNNLKLDPETTRKMGHRILDNALNAKKPAELGWRFEDFLCFLFSQISYFEIYKHNYSNTTEEIDLVLKNNRVMESILLLSPIVLISGKNKQTAVGVPALTSLRTKMSKRRGRCKLGFLCASRSIASTVSMDELSYRLDDKIVVLLDGEELRGLLDKSEILDQEIEKLTIEAALS